MTLQYHDAAGRTTYLAGFHAARALIFEKTGRTVRTHKGVNMELHRLTKHYPRMGIDMHAFLGRTYSLKAIADYETGPGSEVSREMAAGAIADGKVFVDTMIDLIRAPLGTVPRPAGAAPAGGRFQRSRLRRQPARPPPDRRPLRPNKRPYLRPDNRHLPGRCATLANVPPAFASQGSSPDRQARRSVAIPPGARRTDTP